jgi:hypothetical protein
VAEEAKLMNGIRARRMKRDFFRDFVGSGVPLDWNEDGERDEARRRGWRWVLVALVPLLARRGVVSSISWFTGDKLIAISLQYDRARVSGENEGGHG